MTRYGYFSACPLVRMLELIVDGFLFVLVPRNDQEKAGHY